MADQINVGGIVADLDADPTRMIKGLNAARDAMDAIDREFVRLKKELDAASISTAAYADRCDQLAAAQLRIEAAMSRANDRLIGTNTAFAGLNVRMGGAETASKRLGGAMMQASYIVDDFQYSVMACVNNIGPLVLTLTGSGGLGAAAQVAAVGVSQLVNHSDALAASIGVSPVKTHAQEMEALAKKTGKTADEQERLNKAKREEGEIAGMMRAKSKEDSDAEKAVRDAYAEGGVEKVRKGLIETMKARGTTVGDAEKAKAEADFVNQTVGATFNPVNWFKSRGDAGKGMTAAGNQAKDDAIRSHAERMMNDAANDPLARKILAATARSNPGAFPAGFAESLTAQSPERRAEAKAHEDENEANFNRFKADAAAGKVAGKAGKLSDADQEKANRDDQRESERRLRARKAAEKEAERAEKEAERVQKQKEKETADALEEQFPGISHTASLFALHAMGQRDPATALAGVNAKISQRLQELGVDPQSAEDAAGVIAQKGKKDAKARVERRIDRDGVEDAEARDKPRRKNEVFGLSELTNRIQSAVGGDDEKAVRKKSLSRLDQMAESLANLEKRKTVEFKVTP